MGEREVFDATIHAAVATGSCVMIEESEIVYAGPIRLAPDASGKMLLLSADDFARLSAHLDRKLAS
jgi:hypothetical protein